MKCKDCKYLDSTMPQNGGTRCRFWCEHKNKQYMYDYCREHNIHKMPGFVCYGGGLYGVEPTIKTSPAWCPLKKKNNKEENTK